MPLDRPVVTVGVGEKIKGKKPGGFQGEWGGQRGAGVVPPSWLQGMWGGEWIKIELYGSVNSTGGGKRQKLWGEILPPEKIQKKSREEGRASPLGSHEPGEKPKNFFCQNRERGVERKKGQYDRYARLSRKWGQGWGQAMIIAYCGRKMGDTASIGHSGGGRGRLPHSSAIYRIHEKGR